MISASLVRKALLLLLVLVIAPGVGVAQRGAREIMAEAMARMMEAMGLFDPDPVPPAAVGPPADPLPLPAPLGVPWGNADGGSSGTPTILELMRRFTGQMGELGTGGGRWSPPWKPSRLEGLWEGRNGELLIIQGGRFRIYSPAMQKVDGLIEIRGDRLVLHNPLDGHTMPFEFAEYQGRLVMRDPTGELYLYRRLRLDGWPANAAAASTPP